MVSKNRQKKLDAGLCMILDCSNELYGNYDICEKHWLKYMINAKSEQGKRMRRFIHLARNQQVAMKTHDGSIIVTIPKHWSDVDIYMNVKETWSNISQMWVPLRNHKDKGNTMHVMHIDGNKNNDVPSNWYCGDNSSNIMQKSRPFEVLKTPAAQRIMQLRRLGKYPKYSEMSDKEYKKLRDILLKSEGICIDCSTEYISPKSESRCDDCMEQNRVNSCKHYYKKK